MLSSVKGIVSILDSAILNCTYGIFVGLNSIGAVTVNGSIFYQEYIKLREIGETKRCRVPALFATVGKINYLSVGALVQTEKISLKRYLR